MEQDCYRVSVSVVEVVGRDLDNLVFSYRDFFKNRDEVIERLTVLFKEKEMVLFDSILKKAGFVPCLEKEFDEFVWMAIRKDFDVVVGELLDKPGKYGVVGYEIIGLLYDPNCKRG